MTRTYRVMDYYDVWGNSIDGYEVNDCFPVGEIEINDDATNEEIIQTLKDNNWLEPFVEAIVQENGDYSMDIIQEFTDYPLYGLILKDGQL